jgi:hypothetical protein
VLVMFLVLRQSGSSVLTQLIRTNARTWPHHAENRAGVIMTTAATTHRALTLERMSARWRTLARF